MISDPANEAWFDYSIEFCGGTHLQNTQQVRRILIAILLFLLLKFSRTAFLMGSVELVVVEVVVVVIVVVVVAVLVVVAD